MIVLMRESCVAQGDGELAAAGVVRANHASKPWIVPQNSPARKRPMRT